MSATAFKKPRTRRGIKRVLVHIVLFAVLAAFLIPVGIVGMVKYDKAKEQRYHDIRTEYYSGKLNGQEKTTEYGVPGFIYQSLCDILLTEELSEKERKVYEDTFRDKILNHHLDDVRNSIVQGYAKGESEEKLIRHGVDIYVERVQNRLEKKLKLDEQTIQTVTNEIYARLPEATKALIAKADSISGDIDKQSVMTNLNLSETGDFMLMRYGSAILIIGLVCLAVALLLTVLWLKGDYDSHAKLGRFIEPFDYLLPFLVGVAIFTLYPMVRVFIMSFQERYHEVKFGFGASDGWGLGNYAFVLTGAKSEEFMRSLSNTALYVLFTVPITAALAIVIAYLLNQKSKLTPVFQTAYFLPMVTTATAIGLVWRLMFNTDYGLINSLLAFFQRFFGAPVNQDWLMKGSPKSIPMTVLVVYGIWSSLPFTTILLLSGLQNIDESLYTVAKVDGSKPMRIFFKITVPLLSPTIGLVLIINSISAFKVYTEVFVLWNGSPQDANMETVAYYILDNIRKPLDGTHSLGYAAAAAMILFAIIFAFTMLQKWVQRKWVYQ